MAHLKTLFLLSLLFAVVILISSKASADNEPDIAQTQGGAQVDDWHGGGGVWQGGGGWEWRRCRYPYCRRCRYPYCREGAGGDETHQAQTETKSGETKSTNIDEHGDKHMP
ncbi:Uncharacterized protein Adt_36799 [Abeliophyllum distichum]|uniref:Glycine-rich protein n=1 Tax=Abeliophyllum distichum TaxID=126358 RepID=A0ABD1QKK3_9LAMI